MEINVSSGFLVIHCNDEHECQLPFDQTSVMSRGKNQATRRIMDTAEIIRLRDGCVSMPLLLLYGKKN